MTDFMTALPVILVQPTCPGIQRAKGVQFLSTCNLCRESHKPQVWLCFLVLSFLSTSICAASLSDGVKTCLNELKPTIEKSDAMLYSPSTNEVEENCKNMSLRCYISELIMVLNEEEIMHDATNCIFHFHEKLPKQTSYDGCPPCEAYALKNITIFLDRLTHLLEEMNSKKKK